MQEAVAVHAQVHEGGLDAGLDVADKALVDIAQVLELGGAVHEVLVKPAVLDHRDAAFVALGDVHQNLFSHMLLSSALCALGFFAPLWAPNGDT